MSYETAKKHVQISERIYRDITDCRPDLEVYFATHSGAPGYCKAEEESELEYQGINIRVYASEVPKDGYILEPDGIIAIADGDQRVALYVLEIKWGWIRGIRRSDLSKLVDSEQNSEQRGHLRDAMCKGESCRIAALKKNFRITKETEFLLISDFYGLMERWPDDCNRLLGNLDRLIPKLKRLDYRLTHDSDLGVIKSFHDYISSTREHVGGN